MCAERVISENPDAPPSMPISQRLWREIIIPEVRRAIVIGCSLKPHENMWLTYPPPVVRAFSPELAALVGYHQHRRDLANFEGPCPSLFVADDVPEHLAAIAALRLDQE